MIGLHPITGLPRDQRWCNNGAFMAQRADQPIETIAGRPCLVAEMDSIEPADDPLDNAALALIRGVGLAEKANFSPPGRSPQ